MTARKEPACPCETWTRTVPMLGLHFYILLEKNFFFFSTRLVHPLSLGYTITTELEIISGRKSSSDGEIEKFSPL